MSVLKNTLIIAVAICIGVLQGGCSDGSVCRVCRNDLSSKLSGEILVEFITESRLSVIDDWCRVSLLGA